jgi:hypothetical protein
MATKMHKAQRGVWVKTRFWQDGPYLCSTTVCVTCGNTEVLSFRVDMRPIMRRVIRMHDRLHDVKSSRPMALKQSFSGFSFPGDLNPIPAVVKVTKSIAKSKLVRKVAKGVSTVVKAAGKTIKAGARITVSLSPIPFVKNVLKGERIDKALVKDFSTKISAATEAAPYVQIVVSTVPGVGSGVSGAIAASVALAKGRNITEALIEATKAAVPGGPAVAFAFDMGVGLAKGKSLDKAAMAAARERLPAGAKIAFDVGLAMAYGKRIQLSAIAENALPKPTGIADFPQAALAAYAVADAQLEAVEKGKKGVQARENVKRALALTTAAKIATAKVGPARAKAAFTKHPGFAKKLSDALVTVAIAKKNAKRLGTSLERSFNRQKIAEKNIYQMSMAAKHDPDPVKRANARKMISVLSIVADGRARLGSIAAAHQGGIPGMLIDDKGRLVKGRFVRKVGSRGKEVLYRGKEILRGNYSRVGVEDLVGCPIPPAVMGCIEGASNLIGCPPSVGCPSPL